MNKWLMGALMVLTMGVVSSCKDYDDDIDVHTTSIESLRAQVSALEAAKDNAASDLAKANEAIRTAQAAADKAQADVLTANKAIEAANERIDAAEAAVKAAKAAAEAAQGSADAAQETANAALTQANAALAEAQAAKAEAQSKLDAAVAEVKAYAAQVAANEAAAAAAQAKEELLNELLAKEAALNAAIADRVTTEEFNQVVAGLATQEALNAALADVNDQIAALKTQLDDNSASVDAQLAAIKAQLDEVFNDAVRKGDLETAIATLNASIAGVTGNLDAVQAELKALIDTKANAETVSAEFAQLKETIQALNQVYVNKEVVEALEGRVSNLEAAVATLDQYYLKSEVDALLAALASTADVNAQISAVNTAIEALNAKIAAAQTSEAAAAQYAELKGLLDGLRADLTALQAAAASEENLTQVKADIQALQEAAAGYATKAEVTALEDALRSTIAALETKVNEKISGEIATLTATVGTNSEKIAAIEETIAAISGIQTTLGGYGTRLDNAEGKIDGLRTDVDNVKGELGALSGALQEIVDELNKLQTIEVPTEEPASGRLNASAASSLADVLKSMMSQISTLNAAVAEMQKSTSLYSLGDAITSIVYRPNGVDAYLYGFPTIKATLLEPQKAITWEFKNGVFTTKDGADVNKQFDIVAYYWLNPTHADISKYQFGFDEVAAKNQITRGKTDDKLAEISANVLGVKDGILSVALKVKNAGNVNDAITRNDKEQASTLVGGGNLAAHAWITTVALQAVLPAEKTADNDTITSDYAILVPDYIKDLLLARTDYTDGVDHEQGNLKNHLPTDYTKLTGENAVGDYSYRLAYNKEDVVDLTKIDIHYDNGTPDGGVMDHKTAIDRGFKFKYTILTDTDYFTLDESKETIAVAKKENTSVGKVANVLVELQADDLTVAYGFISIVITSPEVTVNIDLADLELKCNSDKTTWKTDANTVATGAKWADVKKAIEDAIGVPGALAYYQWNDEAIDAKDATVNSNITKWKNAKTKDNDTKGIISKDATDFKWTFTEKEVYEIFYDKANKPAPKAYKAQLHLNPIAGHPEYANVVVNVTIKNEIYPTGAFAYTQRIQQYWFAKESAEVAQSAEERHEIHGNVEVVAQTGANDEFVFNIASSFFNNKPETYTTGDEILIYDRKGSNYNELATVYFDATKYYVYDVLDDGLEWDKLDAPETSFAEGASGEKYLLYIDDLDAKVLKAVKGGKLIDADAQPVVVLSGTYNNIATYQGWTYFDGSNKDDYANAYDLLNKNDHNELKAGQTFTSHMVLDMREYCFPIDFTENDAFKFDIRYLRPISADTQEPQTITDATDGDTHISLASLARFEDWRGYKFSAYSRTNYLNYYGVRAVKPNLEKAETNINGGWLNLKYFKGLEFIDETTEGSGYYASGYDFISQLGYVTYRNNGLSVGEFQIKLPITLLYDWGETAEQEMIITIKHTDGQPITAREK